MKTAFIINGLDIHHTAESEEYNDLRSAVKKSGYKVVASNIPWKQTTPSQYTELFIKLYEANKSVGYNIVIGNSFGAVAALLSAARIKPNLVLLCSLSPFFKEDISDDWPPTKYLKRLGKRRLADISTYSVNDLADNLNKQSTQFKVLYGEKEHITSPRIVKRSKDTAARIKNSTLIEVKDAPHPFKEPEYIAGIIKAINS